MLVRRIDNRINRTNSKTPEKYLKYIQSNSDEPVNLLNNFHINVSEFFRNPLVFEYIYNAILPVLSISDNKPIRFWSAGCAAGQEAYSLSILLHEYCLREKISPKIQFFATDSDNKIIEQARKAKYPEECLADCKLGFVNKYFSKEKNEFLLKEDIKKMVSFSYDNLLDRNSYAPKESIYGGFDMILCRNVLIYFNNKYHDGVFEKLYRSLSVGKYLVLGEAEIIPEKFTSNFVQLNNYVKIYKKIS